MINEYLKKLESSIIPKQSTENPSIKEQNLNQRNSSYSDKEKLNQSNTISQNKIDSQNNLPDNSSNSNSNKHKLYQKILETDNKASPNKTNLNNKNNYNDENRDNLIIEDLKISSNAQFLQQNERDQSNISRYGSKKEGQVDIVEKLNQLNIQGVNYRYEIATLQSALKENQRKILEQQNLIDNLEKQKENDDKFLLKLEEIYKQEQNKQKNNLNISLNLNNNNSNNFSHTSNIIEELSSQTIIKDKNQYKIVISQLLKENCNLKIFRNQVFDVSKTCEDINENLINNYQNIQSLFKNKNDPNVVRLNEYLQNFNKIIKSSVEMIQGKQNNYNINLNSKEKEISILKTEIDQITNQMEMVKNDKIKDEKIIHDFENQNLMIAEKIEKLEKIIKDGEKKPKKAQINAIKPQTAKDAMKSIMNSLKNNLDLGDKSNVKFMASLSSKIK